jgi:Zn-dependent protease with chaperone function
MTKAQRAQDSWTHVMRWMARFVALIAVGLFVLFAVEAGTNSLSSLSWSRPQGMPLLIALLVALLGVLIAWRWELAGSSMALVGAVAIVGLVCLGSGTNLFLCSLFFITPLFVAGALYLGCCYRTRAVAAAQQR